MVKALLSRLHDWKRKRLLQFSEHVPLRFLICQYVSTHGNDVVENGLKKWLVDLGYKEDSVYRCLYRMKGLALGEHEKMLVEKNGRLSLCNPVPSFVIMKSSLLESWKIVTIPMGLLTLTFIFILPDLAWTGFFASIFFLTVILWLIDDFIFRRIRFR